MYRSAGFTFIELIVTIVVLGIVTAFALPAFGKLIEEHRNREHGRQLLGSLNYARSTAVSHRKVVTLCASYDGEQCSGETDWSSGGLVFIDDNKNGKREMTEELLLLIPGVPTGSRLTLHSISPSLRYRPDGHMKSTGNFKFCPSSKAASAGWVIVFYSSGRPYFGPDRNGNGIPEDGSGYDLTC